MIKAKSLFLLLTFAICLLPFAILQATIRYVSPTGNNIPPYLTWEDAAHSIQDCIDVSEFGDTIYVANGVYEEQVVMINGLSLIGAGTDSCIIDTKELVTTSTFRAVEVADSCLFKGFHVNVYNNSDMGRGIHCLGSGVVMQNKITNGISGIYTGPTTTIYMNNISGNRIGIYVFNSNGLVRKNDISINYNGGQAIHIEAFNNNYYPIIDSNYIETSWEGIRKSVGTTPTIANNIIVLNNGTTGILLSGLFSLNTGDVYNNLIITEPAGVRGIQNTAVQYLRIFNNYMTGNFIHPQNLNYVLTLTQDNIVKHNVVTNAERGVRAGGTSGLVFQYNNIWNNNVNYSGFTPDTTNLSVDPMIVNDDTTQGELDFHLQMFSPLIDAGDPEMIDLDSSRIDIGLYGGLYGETYKYLDLPPRPPRNLTGEIDSGMITIRWNPNTEADFGYYKLFRDTTTGFTPDTTNFIMSLTDTFYTHIIPPEIEKYYYKLTAVDNQGNESQPSEELKVVITSLGTGEPTIISNYILYQNYPNPFNPSTKIGYKLKERGYVKMYVYSVTGELVSVLVNQTQEAGYYEVEFDESGIRNQESGIRDLASGVYIYQIMVKNENNLPVFTDMKKMILIK
jgi:hypothetical protein